MRYIVALIVVGVLASDRANSAHVDPASDAPAARSTLTRSQGHIGSNADALAAWRKPEDVNDWISARFEYDNDRAVRLSESQRAVGQAAVIHEPSAFFNRPAGICVDLARFVVETLRAVAPELSSRYVMIELTPVLSEGQVLRRHWIASFERNDGYYFFADSKYPGKLSGPYASVESFIVECQAIRQREIVAFRQLDSYLRQAKAMQQLSAGDR